MKYKNLKVFKKEEQSADSLYLRNYLGDRIKVNGRVYEFVGMADKKPDDKVVFGCRKL